MPILFPANRISKGEFEFEGRRYCFPVNEPKTGCHIHGLLHTAEFELVQQSENFVKCRYLSNDLYNFFPHKFAVEITYTLLEQGLLQEVYIYNLSDIDMPVFLGFHTTFNIPFAKESSGENVRIFAEVGNEIERNDTFLPTGKVLLPDEITRQLNNGEFIPFGNKISRHYNTEKCGKIELLDIEKRIKIVYNTDKKFSWRLLYNGDAKNYICIEPQNCIVDCLNSVFDHNYSGFDYIRPKAYKKYVSQIYIEEF